MKLDMEIKILFLFNYNTKNKTLIWNIGKLIKGEKIIVNYIEKIIKGTLGDIILSIGLVNNIPSSTVINTIGIYLTENQKN